MFFHLLAIRKVVWKDGMLIHCGVAIIEILPKVCSFGLRISFRIKFCLSLKQAGVFRFHAETGQTSYVAESIEQWACVILANYADETGWTFVNQWQAKNGRLPAGKRLMLSSPCQNPTFDTIWILTKEITIVRIDSSLCAQILPRARGRSLNPRQGDQNAKKRVI